MNYKVIVKMLHDPTERLLWCEENVGRYEISWTSVSIDKYREVVEYYFVKEEDAMLFSLRWLGQDK